MGPLFVQSLLRRGGQVSNNYNHPYFDENQASYVIEIGNATSPSTYSINRVLNYFSNSVNSVVCNCTSLFSRSVHFQCNSCCNAIIQSAVLLTPFVIQGFAVLSWFLMSWNSIIAIKDQGKAPEKAFVASLFDRMSFLTLAAQSTWVILTDSFEFFCLGRDFDPASRAQFNAFDLSRLLSIGMIICSFVMCSVMMRIALSFL